MINYLLTFKKLNLEKVTELIVIGLIIILFNFPYLLFEIFLGNTIHSFVKAYSLDVFIKIFGGSLAFFIARYLLSQKIALILKSNKIYRVINSLL